MGAAFLTQWLRIRAFFSSSAVPCSSLALQRQIFRERAQNASRVHFSSKSAASAILSKACEPDEEPTFLEKLGLESVYMCCCPLPYAPCKKAERSKTCDAALATHLAEGVVNKENAVEKLQMVRADMWRTDPNCQKHLAAPEPISKCGYTEGLQRSLARADLFCETVTWQWEQLGDGNPEELTRNECPIPVSDRGVGDTRKGQSLEHSEL